MKTLSACFLGLLYWAQYAAGPELVDKPLSMFRDGDYGPVGYALFALLLAMGGLMVAAQRRAGRTGAAMVFALALALLLLVALTPSFDSMHEAAASLLLFTLFGYYAIQLLIARTGLLYVHLAMPIALAPLLGVGYGPWQKAVIVYLVLAINIHWHLLAVSGDRRAPSGAPPH